MKFRFCGEGDCPDWVLAGINTLSRLTSIKLKLLGQIVVQGLLNPPLNVNKAEKLFTESKLDPDIDLKTCIACLSFIITSTVRYHCDHGELFSELQQLGLPREHSTSVKKVVDDNSEQLVLKFKSASLQINRLQEADVYIDPALKNVALDVTVNGKKESAVLSPLTVDVLLENLKTARITMSELVNSSYEYN